MKKVIVILSVYNGEKYLHAQLDSLFAQTYSNLEIYARDDGSTDQSPEILQAYAKKQIKGKKLTIIPTGKVHWGYPACFIKLLRLAKDGDYYFWCDQDDVWLPNKVNQAVKKLSQIDSNVPAAHFGAYFFCDDSLKTLHLITPPRSPIYAM